MKLILGLFIAFTIILAGLATLVVYMFLTGEGIWVGSLTELVYDLVIIQVAMALTTVAWIKLLKLKRIVQG